MSAEVKSKEGEKPWNLSKMKKIIGSTFLTRRTKVIRKKNRVKSHELSRKKKVANSRILSSSKGPAVSDIYSDENEVTEEMDPFTLSFLDPLVEEEYLTHYRKLGAVSWSNRREETFVTCADHFPKPPLAHNQSCSLIHEM